MAGLEGEGDVVEGGFVGRVSEGDVFGFEDRIRHFAPLDRGLNTKTQRLEGHEEQLV